MSVQAAAAASALIKSWSRHVSPRAHSVWVRTEIDNETGEAVSVICVARNPLPPRGSQPFEIPARFKGFEIRKMPWGPVAGYT